MSITKLSVSGRNIAYGIRAEIRRKVAKLDTKPGLAAILVGNNPSSKAYIRIKKKACEETGIRFQKYSLPETVSEKELLELINQLNQDQGIHGILVQLPLPERLDKDKIIAAIDPSKDIDGFHPKNARMIKKRKKLRLVSPVILAALEILESAKVETKGKKALVVANSPVFAKSSARLLEMEGMRAKGFIMDHRKPERNRWKLRSAARQADILIVAIGQPKYIKTDMVKEGAVVIDVGYNMVEGRSVGDVDFENVSEKASLVTPVPGGIGPVTVAMLARNVLSAAKASER